MSRVSPLAPQSYTRSPGVSMDISETDPMRWWENVCATTFWHFPTTVEYE